MDVDAPSADDYRDALRRLRVLVVGGGAIGQVYGHHLVRGGTEVSYYLKPEHAGAAAEGFDLHHYGVVGLRPRRQLKPAHVYTDHRQLRSRPIDQIWVCVSSPALRSGFVEQLHDACPRAVWVSFQPGLEDREYLVQRVGADKLVVGLVNYIAYQAPLPGEELWPPGIAYFLPPFSMTQFTGPEPYGSAVANLLQAGGLPAGVRPDTVETARFGSSVLIPFVIALECEGWSWSRLRSNAALLKLLTDAVSDLQVAIEKATRTGPGSFSIGQRPFFWKFALFAAPKLVAFPIEPYFEHHFSKVRAQTDQMVDDFAQLCRDNALISRALESLRDQWRKRRQPLAARETPSPDREAASASAQPPARVTTHVDEPTRPMRMANPAADDEGVQPIEVAFGVAAAGAEGDDHLTGLDSPLGGLDGETSDADILDAELMGDSISSLDMPTEPPMLDVELEPAPPLEPDVPKANSPVLRSLTDLDRVAAIEDSLPNLKKKKPLPFEVEEAEEQELPSLIVDDDLQTADPPREMHKTMRNPDPGEVHFRDEVPEEKRPDLKRQDFIQTEFATESQNADLRNLKERLRSRLGAKQGISPALDEHADDS